MHSNTRLRSCETVPLSGRLFLDLMGMGFLYLVPMLAWAGGEASSDTFQDVDSGIKVKLRTIPEVGPKTGILQRENLGNRYLYIIPGSGD